MKFARIRTIAAWASLPILLLGGIGLARAHAGLGRSLRPSLQADLAAPAPPASLLPDLQLPQPFTLMFDATQRAIRTPATVALRLKQRRAALDAQVAAGTLTRAEADDQYHREEDFEKSDPGAIQSTINIAARDGKLIVKSGETGPNKAQMVTMFDGRWSIAYDTSHTDEQPLDQADIQVGPVLWMTAPPLPLPGAGLPFAPLISPLKTGMPALIAPPAEGQTVDARILDVDGTAGWGKTPEAPYSSGTARVRTVDGKSQVLQLIKQGRVREQWDYSNHVLFSGIWIARHIEFRQSIDGVPNSITTYDLKDFHTDAPPLTDFSIDHRLVDLESVNYHEGDKTLQFRFRRGAGAWQDQANSAEVGH